MKRAVKKIILFILSKIEYIAVDRILFKTAYHFSKVEECITDDIISLFLDIILIAEKNEATEKYYKIVG